MSRMSYVKRSEVITEEGYRLAPFLLRMASIMIDLAFYVGSAILIFFLLSTSYFPTLIDAFGTKDAQKALIEYQIASGLVVRDESNVLKDISSEDYRDYESAITYYYLDYESGDNANNPAPLYFTIQDYNQKILGLPEDDEHVNHSAYYDFVRIGGVAQYDQKGVLKESLYVDGVLPESVEKSLLSFYRDSYARAQDSLMARPYYKEAQNQLNVGYLVVESIALYVPFLIFYLIIPLTNVPSQTLGRKWMHLALGNVNNGVALEKWKVSMRAIPFALTALLAIIFNDVRFSLTTAALVLLVSAGLMVFTKKRRTLSDFVSLSVWIREEDLMIKQEKEEDA